MKQSRLLKQMAEYFYWGPSLSGPKFVRGRDVPESLNAGTLDGNTSKYDKTCLMPLVMTAYQKINFLLNKNIYCGYSKSTVSMR